MIYNEHIIYDIFVICWKQLKYHTIDCPPVRVDNPRALASGLSYIQVDKHGITILNYIISVDLAHHEIVLTNVGRLLRSNTRIICSYLLKPLKHCCIFMLEYASLYLQLIVRMDCKCLLTFCFLVIELINIREKTLL